MLFKLYNGKNTLPGIYLVFFVVMLALPMSLWKLRLIVLDIFRRAVFSREKKLAILVHSLTESKKIFLWGFS